MIETITDCRRVARWLQCRCFVATAIVVGLLAETAYQAYPQTSFPAMYEFNHAVPVSEPASGARSDQPQESPWDSFTQGWDKFHKQLDDRGIQLGIRYDGEIFTNLSGGLRRGVTYLGNLNLQLSLDGQRLVGW